jgi:hypothetical protein
MLEIERRVRTGSEWINRIFKAASKGGIDFYSHRLYTGWFHFSFFISSGKKREKRRSCSGGDDSIDSTMDTE